MKQFIYVFGREDRDALLRAGFTMLTGRDDSDIYIFAAIPGVPDGLPEDRRVYSDIFSCSVCRD